MNLHLERNFSMVSNREDIVATRGFSHFSLVERQESLQPVMLTDIARLPEIYNMRLNVWEHSGKSEFVNRNLYPNGWYDQLDYSAFHWVVVNEEDNIIASARLNLFHSLEEFPYYLAINKGLPLPEAMPFAFFSRLVVHPDYRQNGLSRKLFISRYLFCIERDVRWSQAFINNERVIKQFEKSGYKNIGKTQIAYHPSTDPHSVNVFIKEHEGF